MLILNQEIEQKITDNIKKYKNIAGVDEAGAGPLAGDLVVAACILDPKNPITGLNDSKKLTEKRREALYPEIIEKALDYCIIHITPQEIDNSNILACRMDGMARAVDGLKTVDYALIDGNKLPPNMTVFSEFVIKGDTKLEPIAAASILAKVSRDRQMIEQSKLYPEYGFIKHKGYGTKLHLEALDKFGACDIHRKSYKPVIKSMEKDRKLISKMKS
jgi:ribonuclease HII